jgi:hypothetical protein
MKVGHDDQYGIDDPNGHNEIVRMDKKGNGWSSSTAEGDRGSSSTAEISSMQSSTAEAKKEAMRI